MEMARSISKRNSENESTSNLLGKPPPGDKSLGIKTAILFYETEDDDNTEEGEYSKIFII